MPFVLVVSPTSGDSDYMSEGVTPTDGSSGSDASTGTIFFSLHSCLYFVFPFRSSCVSLGGTVHDFRNALAQVGANRIEGAQLYFPAQDDDAIPRRILVASRRRCHPNVSTRDPPVLSSSQCSVPGEGDPEVDKVWDVASTPTLESLLPSGSLRRGNSPSSLFSSKQGSTTLGSDINMSELLACSPEILRAGMNNGSLVPAYGSTGGCSWVLTFVV